jgi:hypothetical protein
LGQVGQGGGIQSGGSELPSDGVRLVLELHFLNLCRKSGELGGVTDIPSSKDRLEIQKSSSRPFLTKKFFFLEIVMIEGAISLGSKPPSQGECQNIAVSPLSMVRLMEAYIEEVHVFIMHAEWNGIAFHLCSCSCKLIFISQ